MDSVKLCFIHIMAYCEYRESQHFQRRRRWHPLQCSCLENPMGRGAWWAAVQGVPELDETERLPFHFSLSCIGEGNGTPLQRSCLENPMPGGAWSAAVHGVSELDTTERLHFHFSLSRTGEGNGNPLQCSCLGNPRDGGAWWAAFSGVAQSRTRLKRLSSSSSSSRSGTSPVGAGLLSVLACAPCCLLSKSCLPEQSWPVLSILC